LSLRFAFAPLDSCRRRRALSRAVAATSSFRARAFARTRFLFDSTIPSKMVSICVVGDGCIAARRLLSPFLFSNRSRRPPLPQPTKTKTHKKQAAQGQAQAVRQREITRTESVALVRVLVRVVSFALWVMRLGIQPRGPRARRAN